MDEIPKYQENLDMIELLKKFHQLRLERFTKNPQNVLGNLLINPKSFSYSGSVAKVIESKNDYVEKDAPIDKRDREISKKTEPNVLTKPSKIRDLSENGNTNPSKAKKRREKLATIVYDNIGSTSGDEEGGNLALVPITDIQDGAKKRKSKPRKKKEEQNLVNPDTFFDCLGDTKFDIIVADPPWKYQMEVGSGTAANHYQCLSITELFKIPVDTITNPDCYLFMWTTHPMTLHVAGLMKSWGFRYVTTAFVWIKVTKKGIPRMGLGQHLRSCSEICYLGVKGRPRIHRQSKKVTTYIETDTNGDIDYRIGHVENILDVVQNKWITGVDKTIQEFRGMCGDVDTSKIDWTLLSDLLKLNFMEELRLEFPEIIVAMPTRKHSEKPMHLVIQKLKDYFGTNYSKLSKFELFARVTRPGWSVLGDQIPLIDNEPKKKFKAFPCLEI